MGEIKLSVIVPIYNVEKYVEKCVRSLMEQTMVDGIEFIFINDCTEDKSMEIFHRVLKDYPERKEHVVVVNNPVNLGIYEVRKKGVEIARGEYIGWCDSDDWCDISMFMKMSDVAYETSSDIVVCDYWNVYNNKMIRTSMVLSESPHDAMKNKYKYGKSSFSCFLWHQIIRKCYFENCWNNITPCEFGEDSFMLAFIYYYAKSIRFINQPLIYYRTDNETSLVHLRDTSYEGWLLQRTNLENVESLYYRNDGWKDYHVTINAWLFESKMFYKTAFLTDKEFFNTFRHSSKDIIRFYDWRKLSTWKMYLVHNCYLIMKLLKSF